MSHPCSPLSLTDPDAVWLTQSSGGCWVQGLVPAPSALMQLYCEAGECQVRCSTQGLEKDRFSAHRCSQGPQVKSPGMIL